MLTNDFPSPITGPPIRKREYTSMSEQTRTLEMERSKFGEEAGSSSSSSNSALPGENQNSVPLSPLQQAVLDSKKSVALQKPSEQEWAGLTSMDWKQNQPFMIAKILTMPPYNYTVPVALAITFTAMQEDANPFTGDLYATPNGVIGRSVQHKLRRARAENYNLGVPTFVNVERDWPKDHTGNPKKLERGFRTDKKYFTMHKDQGVKCTMTVNGQEISQTVWFSSAYRNTPTWQEQTEYMLQVRAIDYAIRFGTGVGVSEMPQGEGKQDQEIETAAPSVKGK